MRVVSERLDDDIGAKSDVGRSEKSAHKFENHEQQNKRRAGSRNLMSSGMDFAMRPLVSGRRFRGEIAPTDASASGRSHQPLKAGVGGLHPHQHCADDTPSREWIKSARCRVMTSSAKQSSLDRSRLSCCLLFGKAHQRQHRRKQTSHAQSPRMNTFI